MCWIQIWP